MLLQSRLLQALLMSDQLADLVLRSIDAFALFMDQCVRCRRWASGVAYPSAGRPPCATVRQTDSSVTKAESNGIRTNGVLIH